MDAISQRSLAGSNTMLINIMSLEENAEFWHPTIFVGQPNLVLIYFMLPGKEVADKGIEWICLYKSTNISGTGFKRSSNRCNKKYLGLLIHLQFGMCHYIFAVYGNSKNNIEID